MAPGGRESLEMYSDLVKKVKDQIIPLLEKTNQLIQQREEGGRLLGLDATSLTLLPTAEELMNRLSTRFVLCPAQADDLALLSNVGAQQSGGLPSGSGYAAGGLPSGSGYAAGGPYHGGAPSQVGGFPPGSGYAGGAPYQGLVTLPPQGAPGGGSTPSVSTWMAPSCLDPLEFPYIWLMTLFSVLCAFYSDPGSLLEMLGALTLPGPLDILWIVVKSALIKSIKALLMTYLMVLLYNFIQRVKSFFSKKKKRVNHCIYYSFMDLLSNLTISTILFLFGIWGIFLNRKNIIIILMSIELLVLAVNLNLLFFSVYIDDLLGQLFALLVLTAAAS